MQPARASADRGHDPDHPALEVPNPFASPALRAYLRQCGGSVTAAAYDTNSWATYLYRPGVAEQTPSMVKVDILATLLHETQARGGLSDAQRAVAEGMIEASDNNDATELEQPARWCRPRGRPGRAHRVPCADGS